MATIPGFRRNLRDADLIETKALPAAASTSVQTDPIDTGVRTSRAIASPVEARLKIPALSTTIVPDTKTVTAIIEGAFDEAFTTPETLRSKVFTGAGGVGIDEVDLRIVLPDDCPRYVRGKVTFGADTTTGAAHEAEFCILASGEMGG
jgi:hypothetical protein